MKPILFIDDGGVINDNNLRGPQWQQLVGRFLAPRLGGTQQAWAEANRQVIEAMLEPQAWAARGRAAADYAAFERAYQLDWLGMMAAIVGVPVPPENAAVQMAKEATTWVIAQVQAAFPGAVQAIHRLHGAGYTLYTASGEPSYDLAGYLGGLGVGKLFTRLYGPDLVGAFKIGPEFYRRILADAGVTPAQALVVDDNPDAAAWAREAGARTVLVGSKYGAADHHIRSLAELPGLMGSLGS